jgi:hypothetical protein
MGAIRSRATQNSAMNCFRGDMNDTIQKVRV